MHGYFRLSFVCRSPGSTRYNLHAVAEHDTKRHAHTCWRTRSANELTLAQLVSQPRLVMPDASSLWAPPLLPCCAPAFFVGVRSRRMGLYLVFNITPQCQSDRHRREQPVALVLVCRRQRCLGGVLGCPSGRRARDGRHLAHDHRQDWNGGNEMEAGGRHSIGGWSPCRLMRCVLGTNLFSCCHNIKTHALFYR